MVFGDEIHISTKGEADILDITGAVDSLVAKSGIKNGTVTVFVSGSTAGVTTVEYEPGLIADLRAAFERIAPRQEDYQHDRRWGDGNGHAHVRASLLGASFTAPVRSGKVALGTWQQIVLIDFDNRPRSRDVLVQVVGD